MTKEQRQNIEFNVIAVLVFWFIVFLLSFVIVTALSLLTQRPHYPTTPVQFQNPNLPPDIK